MRLVKTDLNKKYLFPSGAENTYVIVVSERIPYFMQLEEAALLCPGGIFPWHKCVSAGGPGMKFIPGLGLETGPEGS